MAPTASTSSDKLSVPAFLKLLTTGGVGLSTSEAMGSASALIKAGYNKANVANPLSGISEPALVAAGVTDPETRKQIIAYGRSGKGRTPNSGNSSASGALGGSPGKRKRPKRSDLDKPLPVKAEEKEAISLEFDEVLEDYLFHDRSLVINRAPVMTAWATVVAERLGFSRQEALSIAHTYTNMNATSKGVSLGIYSPEKGKQRTTVGPSQPYVDLMGRRVPVLALQTGEWRGIANGAIAEPEQAFGYIQRSFRQHMSAAIGAFKLLAETIEPDELNKLGFNLYADFRPDVHGWGERGQLHLGKVLDLRRRADGTVKEEEAKLDQDDMKTKESEGSVLEGVTASAESTALQDGNSSVAAVDASVENASEVFIKEEKLDDNELASLSKADAEQGDRKRKMTHSPPILSPDKRAKVEPEVEEWDDGGIADDDLAGL